jgi:tetratricopeptide (TPR) repeat protein
MRNLNDQIVSLAAHGCAGALLWLCAACSGAAPAEPVVSCLRAERGADPARAALALAQRSAADRPSDVSAWVGAGEAWLRVARTHAQPAAFRAAQDCSERALQLEAASVPALHLRAQLLLNAHRFREARAAAQALVQREPADVLGWATLSDAALELGDVEAATEGVQQMLDRKPGLAAYGRAAHLAWLRGDRAGAKRLYRAAIDAGRPLRDPEPRAWLLVQAAWVFWHEGDHAGARNGFALALAELPDYAPALAGLGRSQLSAAAADGGRGYADAIRSLTRALSVQPLAETAWWLGDAYAASGDAERARAAYAQVEALGERGDPRTLALFYATQGRKDRAALRLARRAYREREDVYSRDALALALYRNGELAQAAKLAESVLAAGVPEARLLYHAGLVLRAAGAAARGGEAMQRALALNPHFDLRLTGDLPDARLALR